MRETFCYLAFVYDTGLKLTAESSDKNQTDIPLGAERFRSTSVLPASFIGIKNRKIHDTSFPSNMKCYVNIRKELFADVVLSSGTTTFQRIGEHMTKELRALASPAMKIKVVPPPEKKFSMWIVGSILSLLRTFLRVWISKSEYSGCCPTIAHRKRF